MDLLLFTARSTASSGPNWDEWLITSYTLQVFEVLSHLQGPIYQVPELVTVWKPSTSCRREFRTLELSHRETTAGLRLQGMDIQLSNPPPTSGHQFNPAPHTHPGL